MSGVVGEGWSGEGGLEVLRCVGDRRVAYYLFHMYTGGGGLEVARCVGDLRAA